MLLVMIRQRLDGGFAAARGQSRPGDCLGHHEGGWTVAILESRIDPLSRLGKRLVIADLQPLASAIKRQAEFAEQLVKAGLIEGDGPPLDLVPGEPVAAAGQRRIEPQTVLVDFDDGPVQDKVEIAQNQPVGGEDCSRGEDGCNETKEQDESSLDQQHRSPRGPALPQRSHGE
jgi:hypothetical protein